LSEAFSIYSCLNEEYLISSLPLRVFVVHEKTHARRAREIRTMWIKCFWQEGKYQKDTVALEDDNDL
jgi:hypothetical protein